MNPRSHVFISYARSDGAAFARHIHERLEQENVTCWRDRLDLEAGEPFWRQLEAGIATARWMLIVLTPGSLRSEWTAREWREARKRGVPICPVWPRGASELKEQLAESRLPAGMQAGHIYIPFPDGEETPEGDTEDWRNLTATLRLEKEPKPAPFMVPPVPPDYVNRPDEVAAVSLSLLSVRGRRMPAITTLRGVGGIGKTTLARAVAHSNEVIDTFYDGILWATLGTRPKLVEIIRDLCRALGDLDVHLLGRDAAESKLRGLLENRHCLLIIDDVWGTSDLQSFLANDVTVATLVTTRIAEVARSATAAARVTVTQMTASEASEMLLAAVPHEHRPSVQRHSTALAKQLGWWPLLLKLAAAQLRAQFDYGESPDRAFQWIEGNLCTGGATVLDGEGLAEDFDDPRTRDRAFATSIGGSLTLLRETERRAFLDLGIFAEDIDIPLATAGQLWAVDDPKVTALKLADLALIDLQLGDHPIVSLHDQILDYAARRLKTDRRWVESHRRLLAAWKDAAAPPDEYAWRWVCHHLKEASEEARLLDLLFDYDALAKRLAAKSVGVDRLVADYGLIGHVEDGVHLQRVLSGAAHILVRHPDVLAQQLVGRVTLDSPRCQQLLASARGKAPRHVLLPRTPSLAAPAGVLRQVVRHQGEVSRLVLTVDGRVVTGGRDGRVYCASLDRGVPVCLAKHDSTVSELLLTGDGRVLTGGQDGRVYCVGLDGGEPVPIARHEGTVGRVALTADGRVVTSGADGRVYCVRLDGSSSVLLLRHRYGFVTVALTGDGRVVTGGNDGLVYCTALDGGEPVFITCHGGRTPDVSALALTGDGRVVTGGSDGGVICASLDGNKTMLVAQHEGELRQVSALALTGDGRVVTGGWDGRVYCASLDRDEPVLLAHHQGSVRAIALTGDGRVVTGGEDGRVYCAALDGGEPLQVAQHEPRVDVLALTGDGRVVTGGGDGRVYCAWLDSGAPVLLARHASAVSSLLLTGDGRVVTGGADGLVFCARLDGGDPVRLAQHEFWVLGLALAANGRVVTRGADGRVYSAELDRGEPRGPAERKLGISALELTGDGRVITAGRDGRVECVPLDGSEAVPLAQHEAMVSAVALTGDGRLVSGGGDGRVYCLQLSGGDPVLLAQHKGNVSALTLTGDGRVVTGGWDGLVNCTRLDGAGPVRLVQRERRVEALVLTGDGRVVIGFRDGAVYCVPLDGGEPLRLAQHEYWVVALAVTGDGRVVTGGADGRVLCARLDGGEPVLLAQHEEEVEALALTGDGRVVTTSRDRRVYCARLDGGEPVLLARREVRVSALALTGDRRVVTGGRDGRVDWLRLDGDDPVRLAQHEAKVSALVQTGDGRLISAGEDGSLFVTDLATRQRCAFLVSDTALFPISYSAADRVIVAGDVGGHLHILPLGERA